MRLLAEPTGAVLLELAQALERLAEREPHAAARLLAEAAERVPGGPSVAPDPHALALAVVDRTGARRRAGPNFDRWLGDPRDCPDVRDLLGRAKACDGVASGIVRTTGFGSLSAVALDAVRAAAWPILADRMGGAPVAGEWVVAVFAPSRSEAVVRRAADALGLTPLESRLTGALMHTTSLADAAQAVGIGRETAKDALERAMRRCGVRRAQDLVARVLELACEAPRSPHVLDDGLGLTPAELALAGRLALGETEGEAALELGLSPHTVKTRRRAIFAKLAVHKDRDLRRLMLEASELRRLAQAGELIAGPAVEAGARLRVVPGRGERIIAALDYGPESGEPVIVTHGYSTGRTVPPPLVRALQTKGFRVLAPQRPGYGHTSAAAGDQVQTAAEDLLALVRALGMARLRMIVRDSAAPMALAFAEAWPHLLDPSLLLNPRMPREAARDYRSPLTHMAVLLMRQPGLIAPYMALAARGVGGAAQLEAMRKVFERRPSDARAFADPNVAARLIDDARRLGRQSSGMAAELALYANGWQIPSPYSGPPWRLALSATASPAEYRVWREVAPQTAVRLEGAGVLAQFTHAQEIADLLIQA